MNIEEENTKGFKVVIRIIYKKKLYWLSADTNVRAQDGFMNAKVYQVPTDTSKDEIEKALARTNLPKMRLQNLPILH